MDLKCFGHKFNKYEELKDLFHEKIFGTSYWILIRTNIFVSLQNNSFGFEKWKKKRNRRKGVKSIVNDTYSFLKLIRSVKERKSIIIPHERRQIINGKAQCIYTYFLESKFRKDNISFCVFDYNKSNEQNYLYLNSIETIVSILLKILDPFIIFSIGNTVKEIYSEFGQTASKREIKLFETIIKRSLIREKIIKAIIKKIKPDIIYLVDYYNHKNITICQVARELNIKTVELQHGPISQFSIQYCFPKNIKRPKGFPDYFLFFGKNWMYKDFFPIANTNQFSIGFYYLDERIQDLKNNYKEKDYICLISQPSISKTILHYAKIISRTGIKIVLRLHPSERNKVGNILEELKDFSNIKVDQNIDAYQTVLESKGVVGIHSTLLFESLKLNKKVFIIEANLSEVATNYDYQNEFILINQHSNFEELFSSAKNKSNTQSAFFDDFNDNGLSLTLSTIESA